MKCNFIDVFMLYEVADVRFYCTEDSVEALS